MPNWIGDFLMALSVATRKSAQSEIPATLVIPEHLIELGKFLTTLPCIAYKRKTKADMKESIRNLKEGGFDQFYLLPHSFSSGLFAFRSGIKSRVGIPAEMRGLLLTNPISKKVSSRDHHLTEEYCAVLGIPYSDPSSWRGFSVDADNRYKGVVVLCPGAAFGPAKQWTRFGELVKLLTDRNFVILGSEKDGSTASSISSIAPSRVLNLTGKTTLPEAARIIAASSVVISNDSGLMHLAGYLGAPVVGIYGSTNPVWTRPLGSNARIARTSYKCSPCYKRVCEKENYTCLSSISVEKVTGLAREIIR